MEKIKVSFEISVDGLKAALQDAGESCGLVLKDLGIADLVSLEKELNSDIDNYITHQLVEFLEEGINQDCYLDFFEEDDEE